MKGEHEMPNRNSPADVVVARETIVIVVGARPVEYARIEVTDKRTSQKVEIDDTDHAPIDEGEEGKSYVFREGQKVRADHPAVEACPGAFRPIDPTDALIYPDAVPVSSRTG